MAEGVDKNVSKWERKGRKTGLLVVVLYCCCLSATTTGCGGSLISCVLASPPATCDIPEIVVLNN